MTNENRIVRIRNKKVHDVIITVAKFHNATYQLVFEEWCNMMTSGYTTGEHTSMILSHRVADRIGK